MQVLAAANAATGLAVGAQSAANAASALMPQSVMPHPKPMPAPPSQARAATPASAPRVNAAAATVMAAKAVNAASALKSLHQHPKPFTLKHPRTKLR